MSRTYALLGVSQSCYDELVRRMRDAGYDHAIMECGEIDMHGVAIEVEGNESEPSAAITSAGRPFHK